MFNCFDETSANSLTLSCNNSHNTSLSGTILKLLFILYKTIDERVFIC